MLTPFDDFPIHQTPAPINQTVSADPNHYDRYWFNGYDRDGAFYLGGAMGHYPNRGVIDAALSVVHDGVEHSVFASGLMPADRSTAVGPLRIEVVEPLRVLRFVVGENDSGLSADVIFVMDRGKLVEQGTHRELLDRGGLNAQLYDQQFRGGLVEAECEDGVVLSTGEVVTTGSTPPA